MPRYKIKIAFDGTRYAGWQVQSGKITVQGTLQAVFQTLLGYPVHITGCGRTDAGVHAKAHVAHLDLEEGIDVDQLFYRASKIVPPDIRIVSREKVASDFHARYSATAKTYRYYFSIGPSQEPFRRNFCYEAYPNTDLRRMEVAVKDIIGEHDFTSFAHKAHEGSAKNAPVKIISKAHFGKDEELFFFEVTGNGFLHKMVRNIMGTLFEIGRGKRPVEDMAYLLQIKDRRKAGQTAPAKGLFLVEVQY